MLPNPALAQPLPCLDSSLPCVDTLTAAAIAHSLELQTLGARVDLVADRVEDQRARRWTAWINPNPVTLLQNVLGGGDRQRIDLAIADLEVQTAELQRRQAEVATQLREQVVALLLTYEALERQRSLLDSRLVTHAQRVAVLEISYRLGQGTTETMLPLWQRTEELQAQLTTLTVQQQDQYRQLLELTGYESPEPRD